MSLCLPRELAFGANKNLNVFYWEKIAARKTKQMQNCVDEKFHLGWNTGKNNSRTAMLSLFGRWASARINSFVSSPHSPLRHSVS